MYNYFFLYSANNVEPVPIIHYVHICQVLVINIVYKYFQYEYRVSGTQYRDQVEAKYRVSDEIPVSDHPYCLPTGRCFMV